ncbi:MAG: cysteine synthase family protein [Acidobacteria bacterium]|nr:cysteine synthase family protein [Acidobacteriota bacterium]
MTSKIDGHIKVVRPGEQTSLLRLIGNTPLIKLERIAQRFAPIEISVKAEWFNPGGSVKDRAAWSMIRDGELSGALQPGKVILDATSGNTGIAYAMIGANRGYKVCLCLPANASPERKKILKAYGVEMVLTDPDLSTDGSQQMAKQMYAADPEKYFYPDQYNNPANWRAHYETTGPEIIRQTDGKITHFVAGLGTTGTFIGTSRRLREFNPAIQLISVQPDSAIHGLEGMKHLETAMVPGIYDATVADEDMAIDTERAYHWVKMLAREEGLLAGISCGAVLDACFQIAARLEKEPLAVRQQTKIVTIFPDAADKYLSERFWDEPNE